MHNECVGISFRAPLIQEETTLQTTETQETQQGAAATGAPAPADLTVQDLQALKVIIDVASQRGAFRPNEMQTVGATYTKLEQFLGAIAQAQSATAQG